MSMLHTSATHSLIRVSTMQPLHVHLLDTPVDMRHSALHDAVAVLPRAGTAWNYMHIQLHTMVVLVQLLAPA